MITDYAEQSSMAHVKKARFARARWVLLLPVAVALASCAGAHLGPVTEATVDGAAAPLLVVVKKSPDWVDAKAKAGRSVDLYASNAAAIDSRLAKGLDKSKVAIDRSGQASSGGSDLILEVDLSKVDAGNTWLRDIVGFGAGKSRLQAHATLLDPRVAPARHLLEFDVSANSGDQPGLILSTNPVGAGVKGASIAVQHVMGDGHQDADFAAGAIAKRVAKYYKARGWLNAAAAGQAAPNQVRNPQDPSGSLDNHPV